ncbi:MAG: glycosyltransferase [Eubacterium sp.]|nr:glycosyltransferase [Eubacterium sp.]
MQKKEKYFAVVSQLIERKQIDKIIDKFSAFSKANPEYKLYIFGEGDKESGLKEQVKDLKLEEKVVFFGKASHDELKSYLSKASALLVYTRKDNNMVSIVESIACATPVVTTSVPYNASYIKENGLGIVNDAWNESDLERIVSDKKYIENCLNYRNNISTKGKVEAFLSVKNAKNILLSSYSVNPFHGSEDGIGWNWTLQLAKHFNAADDRIFLVTKKVNEADTRRGIEENGLKNVKLTIVDTPDWLNWYREHRSAFHHLYYMLWQRYAYARAKRSKIDFDIIHHITMVDFRIPGHMHKFKKPETIFGPVGGGQSTPEALKSYEASRAVEKFREAINKSRAVLPSYKKAMKNFNRVFAINSETQEYMSSAMGKRCEKLCELALADEFRALEIQKKKNASVKILYLGRLIEKKGIMLLLDVIKAMPTDGNFTLEIYGGGPLESRISEYIKDNSLENRVKLCGEVEHSEVSNVYSTADIFVMPSLRETSGNVLVEAMAHSLPVVALDMSVASDFKEHGCGEFINVKQSREAIINEFSDKLTKLIDDPGLRTQEGEKGYAFVNEELSWEKKFEKVYDNLY